VGLRIEIQVSGTVQSGLWIEILVFGLCNQNCGLRSRCLGLCSLGCGLRSRCLGLCSLGCGLRSRCLGLCSLGCEFRSWCLGLCNRNCGLRSRCLGLCSRGCGLRSRCLGLCNQGCQSPCQAFNYWKTTEVCELFYYEPCSYDVQQDCVNFQVVGISRLIVAFEVCYLPAALRAAQICRYLFYSEADFDVFCPDARCTDGGEIWHGGGDLWSPPPCQISPHRYNGKGVGPPKLKFLLRFDRNVEYKRPAEAYPLRDFYKICKICTSFQVALGVKIWLDLLKGLWSYGCFKLRGSGFPQIFSAP